MAASPDRLVDSQRVLVDRLTQVYRHSCEAGRLPVLELRTADPDGATRVATALGDRLGLSVGRVDAAALPTGSVELERFVRTWDREAALGKLALLI